MNRLEIEKEMTKLEPWYIMFSLVWFCGCLLLSISMTLGLLGYLDDPSTFLPPEDLPGWRSRALGIDIAGIFGMFYVVYFWVMNNGYFGPAKREIDRVLNQIEE